ncbi:MAG TPA: SDR family oxidoreductase [Rhizomicrobium sp.]|nr:SDR family oxidoreductase [Rhizomicrobium sp.]
MGRLSGKVALITGAGAGIGHAAARLFAAEGAKIAIADISEEGGRETLRVVAEAGGDAIFCPTDVTEEASVAACVETTAAAFGGLHVLYNNAGGSSPLDGPVTETSLDMYHRVVTLNLTSVWLTCHHAIPVIVRSGGGAVINTSSSNAVNSRAGSRHAYATAKGGVISLTQSIAFDYAVQGVRANVIVPGLTASERVAAQIAASEKLQAHLQKLHPLGNGAPVNVAYLALYLASDESAYTTGQIFAVNNEVIG